MYLFTRHRRPEPSQLAAATGWFTEAIHQVREATGKDASGWSTVLSPSAGTCIGAVWVEHLEELEQMFDKLRVSHEYQELVARSAGLFNGPLDDSVVHIIHGDRARTKPEYALMHRALPANGKMREAIAIGVDAAQMHERITGVPVAFGTGMSGPFGECHWIAAFDTIGDLEQAATALNTSAEWPELIDRMGSLFADTSVASATSTIARRMT